MIGYKATDEEKRLHKTEIETCPHLKKRDDQLTKAKDIIKEFVEWANWQGGECPNFKSIQYKAEQFLKES